MRYVGNDSEAPVRRRNGEEVFSEGPILLTANVTELKLILQRIRRLPCGKWGPQLVPSVWYHPYQRIDSGLIGQFVAIKLSPIHAPPTAVVGLHKDMGSACVIDAALSQYQIRSLSSPPVLP